MKRLVFTVTNDLTYDQRMIRICTSLHQAGYQVSLVGRRTKDSSPLAEQPFIQRRILCFCGKGPFFYIEFNLKLLFHLLFRPADLFCAIDLDTILPCLFASRLRNKKRVYDAHELFTEMKEVVSRKKVYSFWKTVARFAVPSFKNGYTVNDTIQQILLEEYGVSYSVVRNLSVLKPLPAHEKESFIIYQGAINHGRSFETLIPAFKQILVPLHLYGDGNFINEAKALVREHGLEEKVLFKGKLTPLQLQSVTPRALLGITIFENRGLSNYYSLANRFFDYLHAGIPQICVDYPEYRAINMQTPVAVLTDDLSPSGLARTINDLLSDGDKLRTLAVNCLKVRERYNWQSEEKTLLQFYKNLFD
jgi:glycosyltransferase involved in cell wall biosynthesis